MATRDYDPAPLLAGGVEIGLHLELEGRSGEGGGGVRAEPAERQRAVAAMGAQLERLAVRLGSPPAYVDGHHHCHAAPGLAAALGRAAAALGLPMRSVSPRHRRTLRCLGVATPDCLVGRISEREPVLPPALEPLIAGGEPPPGITEWMVHPGRADPGAGSSYDAGRAEDLSLLLRLADRDDIRAIRMSHESVFMKRE